MGTPRPQKKVVADLKASILTPALTSHFQCWFTVPEITGLGGFNEFVSLSCAEASLPSTSLATHQMSNDFTGITERHAYRRQYNDTSSFTFYVDHEYIIIKTFETWIGSIVNEQNDESNNYFYRVKFPTDYQTQIYIKKFERNYKRALTYQFLQAYPISIDSMPVTYEQSSLLKCTVNFNFSRYLVETGNFDGIVNSYDNPDLFEFDYDNPDAQ
tara:strand:+ start:44 stop:685 length:642 start_codon:yes stop_codon:yes gene_type:complete